MAAALTLSTSKRSNLVTLYSTLSYVSYVNILASNRIAYLSHTHGACVYVAMCGIYVWLSTEKACMFKHVCFQHADASIEIQSCAW